MRHGFTFSTFIIGLLIITLPATVMIAPPSQIYESGQEAPTDSNKHLSWFAPRDNITITSNIDFETFGFPGNGSPTDPYIIQGYNITEEEYCISIEDTDAYFIIENCLLTDADESGIFLDNVTHGIITNNIISGNWDGLRFWRASNNYILNNTVFGNDLGIQITNLSNNNTFVKNNVSRNLGSGVQVYSSSSNNTFVNNTISHNSGTGLGLSDTWDNSIIHNTISNNSDDGVYIFRTSNTTLSLNVLENNGFRLWSYDLEEWHVDVTPDNTMNGKPLGYFWNLTGGIIDGSLYDQIILANCTGVTIENGVFNGYSIGLQLAFSTYCNVTNSTMMYNSYGMYIHYSSYNTVKNSTLSANDWGGIQVEFSFNNTVESNTISENLDGLYIEDSSHNVITNNTIAANSGDGIKILYSPDNTLSGNTLMGNGVYILGVDFDMWRQNITADNTQNEKLIGYFWNQTGGILDGAQYDQVILANCTGVTVENGTYEYKRMGIELAFSSLCNLTNNTIFRSMECGVYFYESSNNTVANCTVSESTVSGLLLSYHSSNNTIANNTISKNGNIGLSIYSASNNNTIVNNTIFANSVYGLHCGSGIRGTLIYQNRFGHNININAYDTGTDNHWNISGIGNSWSDYSGTGVYLIPGGAGSIDYYPSIYQPDSTPPTIDHPSDIKYVEGTIGHSITWTPNDENPFLYLIYNFTFLVDQSYWYGGPISISVDGLSVGVYGYRILVADIGFNFIEDIVIVTVVQELDVPTIDSPDDVEYEVGTTGHNITWTPSDANPFYYVIYRNGIELSPESWDGGLITVIVDGLNIGVTNYTIVVFDNYGNWNRDTVLITVVPQVTTTTTTGTTETTPTTTSPTSTPTTPALDEDIMVFVYLGVLATLGIIILVLAFVFRKRK